MHGDDCDGARTRRNGPARDIVNLHRPPRARARCRGAKGENDFRCHDYAFGIEPPAASLDLIDVRTLVDAALASQRVLEVLDPIYPTPFNRRINPVVPAARE